jgi:carbonic anhydrase
MFVAVRSKNVLLLCLFTTLLLAIPAAAQEPASSAPEPWTYSGDTGPSHWGQVSPEFATCGIGKDQSPIDIVNPKKEKLPAIDFSYQASPLKVINNSHSIQVNYAPGSRMVWEGKTYELVQFHFHHMSENTVNGKHAPMELHLVHQAQDGSLAVVAVMLNEGKANKVVNTIWSNIPPVQGKEDAFCDAGLRAYGVS